MKQEAMKAMAVLAGAIIKRDAYGKEFFSAVLKGHVDFLEIYGDLMDEKIIVYLKFTMRYDHKNFTYNPPEIAQNMEFLEKMGFRSKQPPQVNTTDAGMAVMTIEVRADWDLLELQRG